MGVLEIAYINSSDFELIKSKPSEIKIQVRK